MIIFKRYIYDKNDAIPLNELNKIDGIKNILSN